MNDLATLARQALDEVAAAGDLAALDDVRVRWLGKKGTLTEQLKTLGEQNSWSARADDALIRSAVATDASALVVPSEAAEAAEEAPVGGLGALLRWK